MQYKVTALTPLLVGNGDQLSPVDYMVWKDHVNVLDQTRIFKLLARGPRLEGYLTQLRKATKLDFASWGGFAQNFSQRRIPFEHPESTAVWNAAPTENLFIPTFAASLRGAYLPATALKGALRTGLISQRWNAATLERLESSLEGDRLPRRIGESMESQAGASQLRILGAADSAPVPASSFKVYLTRVASVDTKGPRPQLVWKVAGRGSVPPQRVSDSTPLFAEMAVPGTSFAGTWYEKTFFENQEISRLLGWRSVPRPGVILQAANEYAAAQLDSHDSYAKAIGLTAVSQVIERLRIELQKAKEAPLTCLLCLGWGAGFASKAAFPQTDLPAYRKILKSVPAFSASLRDNVQFPKTRRIVFSANQPASLPGWVRAEFS